MSTFARLSHVVTVVALIVAMISPQAYSAAAKITWADKNLVIDAIPGTSKVILTSFTSPTDHEQVDIWLTPEFADFISVQPRTAVSVEAGQPYELTLFVSIPAEAVTGTYEGTMHVRSGKRTIPKPLNITLELSEPSAFIIPNEIADPSRDQVIRDPQLPARYMVKDELVIRFVDGTPRAQYAEIIDSVAGVFVGSDGSDLFQVRLVGVLSVDDAVTLLRSDPRVQVVLPHYLASAHLKPNDPQWNVLEHYWAQDRIELDKAWNTTTGSSDTKIAVVDSGFDFFHEDFGPNFINPTRAVVSSVDLNQFGTYDQSPLYHGTLVAGIVGATANNGKGMAGVLWDADILLYPVAIKDTCRDGECGWNLSRAKDHMKSAIAAGAKVINFSGGVPASNVLQARAISLLYFEPVVRNNPDVLFVFSAGNENDDVRRFSPANLSIYPNVVAVAASGQDDSLADYGSGRGSNWGRDITVAAPGKDIHIPVYRDPNIPYDYGLLENAGTSSAAPFVTGLAGLLLTVDPDLSAPALRNRIVAGAEDAGREIYDGHGNTFHVINAARSIELVLTSGSGRYAVLGLRGAVSDINANAGAIIPGNIQLGDPVEITVVYDLQEEPISGGPREPSEFDFTSGRPNGLEIGINGLTWSTSGRIHMILEDTPDGDGISAFSFDRWRSFPGSYSNTGTSEFASITILGANIVSSEELPRDVIDINLDTTEFEASGVLGTNGAFSSDPNWSIHFRIDKNYVSLYRADLLPSANAPPWDTVGIEGPPEIKFDPCDVSFINAATAGLFTGEASVSINADFRNHCSGAPFLTFGRTYFQKSTPLTASSGKPVVAIMRYSVDTAVGISTFGSIDHLFQIAFDATDQQGNPLPFIDFGFTSQPRIDESCTSSVGQSCQPGGNFAPGIHQVTFSGVTQCNGTPEPCEFPDLRTFVQVFSSTDDQSSVGAQSLELRIINLSIDIQE
jgi:thermitase